MDFYDGIILCFCFYLFPYIVDVLSQKSVYLIRKKMKRKKNRPFDFYGPFYLILLNLCFCSSSLFLDLKTLSAYETMDESKNVSTTVMDKRRQ